MTEADLDGTGFGNDPVDIGSIERPEFREKMVGDFLKVSRPAECLDEDPVILHAENGGKVFPGSSGIS